MNLVLTLDLDEGFPGQAVLSSTDIRIQLHTAPLRFYRHGWQSWSLAAWTDLSPLPVQEPSLLHPMQVDPVYAREGRPHSSWVGAVELENAKILLLGSLGLDAHVTLNGSQLEGHSEPGDGEWFIAAGEEAAVFANFAGELGTRFGSKSAKLPPRVWCSWYSLYTGVDEKILHRIFEELAGFPFDVLQVDDGWQISVGDWEANSKFPGGMPALAERIQASGRKAGLWLAPLIAVKSSRLVAGHPDWFLRDEGGRFVSAGYNWGEPLYALDTTHPEASIWLEGLMKKVREWGFEYLKLDFLYGGALPGKRYQDLPRETAYRNALSLLRESMGQDTYFLACGAPVFPSIGLCDALRVGPDVSGEWESKRDTLMLYNLATPGARNAIRTTIHRFWLGALMQLDPDVAYFRSKHCGLDRAQKEQIQDLARVCNYRATSDPPGWLSEVEKQSLLDFLRAEPRIVRTSKSAFQVDDRIVDFSAALGLPQPLEGLEALEAAVICWLANRPWALRLLDRLGRDSQRRWVAELERRAS